MGEFAETTRRQAGETMRTVFHRGVDPGTDPLLELIVVVLEDGAGGVLPPADIPVTTEQWFTWNRLVTEQPRVLTRMLTRELEHEGVAQPTETEALRCWVARLMLSTLDRLGML